MDQRKMENGQLLKIYKAQRELQVRMVQMEKTVATAKMEVMERQLPMHQQLQVQVGLLGHKVKEDQLDRQVLQDHRVQRARLVPQVHRDQEVEHQDHRVQRARLEQPDLPEQQVQLELLVLQVRRDQQALLAQLVQQVQRGQLAFQTFKLYKFPILKLTQLLQMEE
jgi:hypothetical protein